jgi:hypothetical protein
MGKTHALRGKTSKPLCWESHDHLIDPPFITKKQDLGRPGVRLASWHLHCMSLSIIHSYMSMKHM